MKSMLPSLTKETVSLLILGVLLFLTYFVYIPSIVRHYEARVQTEKEKLEDVVTRLESQDKEMLLLHELTKANNDLLKELKELEFNARNSRATSPKDK